MPIYMKFEPIRGNVEAPVSKSMDMASTHLLNGDPSPDAFVFADAGETAGHHAGGVNVCLGDGSVRYGDGSVRFISDSIDPLPNDGPDHNLLLPYTEFDLV